MGPSATLAQTLAPVWAVMPCAIIAMLAVAGHVLSLRHVTPEEMPPSRRRIRTANGAVMLFAAPIAAYAFCLADTEEPRLWTLSWMTTAGLVTIVVFLAVLDMLNTLRMHVATRRDLIDQIRRARDDVAHASSATQRPSGHA